MIRLALGICSVVALVFLAATLGKGEATTVNAANASGATVETSVNWSGYVVRGAVFTSVSGGWVQPAPNCSAGTASTNAASFWVGLGGDTSELLEQTGTEVHCNADGSATHSAWYELLPAPSVTVKLKVGAGDKMWAAVKVAGSKVTMQLKNLTRKTSFSKTITTDSHDFSSAEWIAEAPSLCSSRRCQAVPLTNFGRVKFTGAQAVGSGRTGTISSPFWSATAIRLVADSFGGRSYYGRYAAPIVAVEAVPSALSAGGGSFSVTWTGATAPVAPVTPPTPTPTPAPAPAPTTTTTPEPAPLP
jgi:hypothetical protein